MKKIKSICLSFVSVLACVAATDAVMAKDIAIQAGTLIDGTMKVPRKQVTILVHDERITDVVKGFVTPPGAEVIDLSQATVMPGLIEAHDHLGSDKYSDDPIGRRKSLGDMFVDVILNSESLINQGFTTTRDAGTRVIDFKAVQYAIRKGRIAGPRIWASLEPLGPVGGHSDVWNSDRYEHIDADIRERGIVRGPIDAVEKVRDHFLRGARVIKIMPSGGVGSLDDDPHAMTMTYEEMKAICDAAHALGLTVLAHAHGLEAIKTATRAGVDSIEHGTFADTEALQAMKAKGTFFDPSLTAAAQHLETAKVRPQAFDPRVLAKGMIAWPLAIKSAQEGLKLGVKIVMGTDQSTLGEGLPKANGITRLVEVGMSPQQAIAAATSVNAELLQSKDIGVVEKGRYADIIAVDGDPLTNIKILETGVKFVMKGGVVYKSNGAMLPGPWPAAE